MRLTVQAAVVITVLLAAGTALTVVPLTAAPSQAETTGANPSAVGNWAEAGGAPAQPVRVTFTTTGLSAGSTRPPVPIGADVVWKRSSAPSDQFHSTVDQNSSPAQDKPSTSVNFSNVMTVRGQPGDGPANPGKYDVFFQSVSPDGTDPTVFDYCFACFTVLAAGPPELTAATPAQVAAGAAAQPVSFGGKNLARGAVVRALTPDGQTDNNLQFTRAPSSSSTSTVPGTALPMQVGVSPGTPPGPRDLEVLNTDGGTGFCSGCLVVVPRRLDSINPASGLNNSSTTTSIQFVGPPGSVDATLGPLLQFVGETDEVTRPLLRLSPIRVTERGADGSSVTADFDLRAAAPGAYQPTLVGVFDQVVVGVCACRLTVLQTSPPALTSVTPARLFRNGTTTVTLAGLNFSKGSTAVVTGGGVHASESQYVSSDSVRVKLTVDYGAIPGPRDVVARNTDGQTSAVCRGCITIEEGSFASPAPSSTTTPTPTPSPSPTPTPSPSTSPTAATSPTGPPMDTREQLAIFADKPDIHPNEAAPVAVEGTPNEAVQLRCYSRPGTTYFTARTGTMDGSGHVDFRLLPGTNTRCYATYGDTDSLDSRSIVISVHTTLSLSARRLAVRSYEFRGKTLPRMAGQLITLYRVSNGSEIRTGSAKTDSDGIWILRRTFTGSGTFPFLVRTSQTMNNAPGQSQRVSVRIY